MGFMYPVSRHLLFTIPLWLNLEDAEPGVNASTKCSNCRALGRQNATEKVSPPFRRIEGTLKHPVGKFQKTMAILTSWELREFFPHSIARLHLLSRRKKEIRAHGKVPLREHVP